MAKVKQEIADDTWLYESFTNGHENQDVKTINKVEEDDETGRESDHSEYVGDDASDEDKLENQPKILASNSPNPFQLAGQSKDVETNTQKRRVEQEFQDRIGNFCEFQCPTCQERFKSWNAFRFHWKFKNLCRHMNKAKECSIKIVWHRCRICNQSVMNDSAIFGDHLRTHEKNYSMEKYCAHFQTAIHIKKGYADMIREVTQDRKMVFTDRVGSLCKFKCLDCFKTFDNFQRFLRHVKIASHSSDIRCETTLELIYHKCRVCKGEQISDIYFLKQHMTSKHCITLKAYAKKFHLKKLNLRFKNQVSDWDSMEGAEIADNIDNLCLFECNVCRSQFQNLQTMNHHIKTTSHGPQAFGKYEVMRTHVKKMVCHECRVCRELVISDRYFLLGHIRGIHKMESLTDYCAKYGLKENKRTAMFDTINVARPEEMKGTEDFSEAMGNKCKFRCPSCTKEYFSTHGMTTHLVRCLMKRVSHKCKICNMKVLCDNLVFTRHLQKFHKHVRTVEMYNDTFGEKKVETIYSDVIGDLCKYKCGKCNLPQDSWVGMYRHLQSTKHGDLSDATRKDFTTKYVAHICRVCNKEIRCELRVIRNHLQKKSHKIGLKKYMEKFGLKQEN